MKKIVILNKKEGETPLMALEAFRVKAIKKDKIYKDIKMTYAGRLDPMASGLLVVLLGEECKNKEKYLNLDKEYEFEILFGFATDTYDILGKVVRQDLTTLPRQGLGVKIKENLEYFTGNIIQKYPMYSSKTVAGKQLFTYARGGIEVEAPEREVEVKSLKFLKIKKINKKNLLGNIEKRIAKVHGDFRQREIMKIWKKNLAVKKSSEFTDFFTASFRIKCTSGTYVRTIANDLGEKIGIPALAFSIKRTKIGKWSKIS